MRIGRRKRGCRGVASDISGSASGSNPHEKCGVIERGDRVLDCIVFGATAERNAMSLFDTAPLPSKSGERPEDRPLADRMRPQSLEEYIGQNHILGLGKPLRARREKGNLSSLIL